MRVFKWGDSLAVQLPQALVDQLGLKEGDELNVVEASMQQIAVEKVDERTEALQKLRQLSWPAPEGFKFDRDEANER